MEASLEGFPEEKKRKQLQREKAPFRLLPAKKSVHSLILQVSISIAMAWGAC